jgi:serine protease Do
MTAIDVIRRRRTVNSYFPPLRHRLAAVAAASALVVSVAAWNTSGAGPAVTVAAAPVPGAADRVIGSGTDSYAPVVSQVAPAVVTIRSERRARSVQQHPFMQDPRFREFFGDRFREQSPGPERREGGLGSGVIVSADGYILTNHHVVDGADKVQVELTDRRQFTATVVGSDPPSDLAVLKIDAGSLPVLPLGNSEHVEVGDIVLAIGNPMGVGQTVTMGIISAKGRATGLGDGSFEDFLQTDAPINRGNSGGALVNTRGELVGINSQILSPSGGNIGIGFSIPVNMAQAVMKDLIDHGQVRRGRLGVTVQPITSDIARSLQLDRIAGALVSGVEPGSAAARAGLQRGDVILAINGEAVTDSNALRNRIAQLGPQAKAELEVVRDGRARTLTATLEELPGATTAASPAARAAEQTAGLAVEPLTPQRARQLGLEGEAGLVVTRINPDGPAASSGFRTGDVIQEVDGRKVASADELRKMLGDGGRPALVLVRRGDQSLFLTLERHA